MNRLFAGIAILAFTATGVLAKGGFPEADAGSHDAVATPQHQTCPTGQAWNAADKKCEPVNSINYNSSKSNTGNTTAAPASAPKNNPD